MAIEEDPVDATAQFQDRLVQVAKDTESLLDRLLGISPAREELGRPPRLLDADAVCEPRRRQAVPAVPGGGERKRCSASTDGRR